MIKKSMKRSDILRRINYHNKKLASADQIKVAKGLSYQEIRKIENNLMLRKDLIQSGIIPSEFNADMSANERNKVKKVLEQKRLAERVEGLNYSQQAKDKTRQQYADKFNLLVKSNADKVQKFRSQLKQLKGFDNLEYLETGFNKKSNKTPTEYITKDLDVLIDVLNDDELFIKKLKKWVGQLNKQLGSQNIPTIKFDPNDVEGMIKKLNTLDSEIKKWVFDSPPTIFSDDDAISNEDVEDFD